MTLCLFNYRHGVLIGLRSLADLASVKPAGTASRRWNISSSRKKPNDFTMSASNPSKRPRSSESEDDRHDRSEGEENEGGMTSALASALEEAEADARG